MSCIEAVERDGRFALAGLVGLREQLGQRVLGHPVLGVDADLRDLRQQHAHALIAVGQISQRQQLFQLAVSLGFTLPTIVASAAQVSRHAVIGEGTVVMPGAIVNAGARIGRNAIINSAALIEHGVIVGDQCHISTGAILNGDVQVGEGSFVGSGCVIREGVRIGRGCLVGMGLALRHDLPDHFRYTGTRPT